jgi:superkiller protein 3
LPASAAWFNLGPAYLALRSCPESLDAYRQVTRLIPADADGWIDLSVAARKCKQLPDALAAARQAVKAAPGSAPAQLNLGLTLSALDKKDDAATAMEAATRIRPDYATAWWSLGLVELERHRLEPALAALARAHQLAPSAVHTTDLGIAYRDRGDLPRAVELFREAVTKDPRYAPARWQLAQTLAASGRCPEALRQLQALPPAEANGPAGEKLRQSCQRAGK